VVLVLADRVLIIGYLVITLAAMFFNPLQDPRKEDSSDKVRQDSEQAFSEVALCIRKFNFVEAEKLTKAFLARVETQCPEWEPLRIRALVILSSVLRLLEDFDTADQRLVQAIQLAALYNQDGSRQELLNDLRIIRADFMRELGQTDNALSLSLSVLHDSATGDVQKVESCIRMAQAYMSAGNVVQYGVCMHMAYAAAQLTQPQSRHELVDIFIGGGAFEVKEGRFKEAIRLYSTAVDLLGEAPEVDRKRMAGLQMYIAEQHERAGDFKSADGLRDRVLREVGGILKADDSFVMDVRHVLALGMIGHAEGHFERAETLLYQNVTLVREHSNPPILVKALIALSKAQSSRGMYADAMQNLREAHEQINKFYDQIESDTRVGVLGELACLLAECGMREEAELLFRNAIKEAEMIPESRGIIIETRLVFALASIIGGDHPDEAQILIERCHGLLDRLPPIYEPVSRMELQLLSFSISPDRAGSAEFVKLADSRLRELRAEYGETFGAAQADLMLRKADAMIRDWDLEGARTELENAKLLLERLAKDRTNLYAIILSRLSETLTSDDSRIFEYQRRIEEIRARAEQAGQLFNDQDPEEFGNE
jgi:hypothetical protein